MGSMGLTGRRDPEGEYEQRRKGQKVQEARVQVGFMHGQREVAKTVAGDNQCHLDEPRGNGNLA